MRESSKACGTDQSPRKVLIKSVRVIKGGHTFSTVLFTQLSKSFDAVLNSLGVSVTSVKVLPNLKRVLNSQKVLKEF